MLESMSPFANMSTLNVVIGIVFAVLTLALFIPGALATAGKLPGNKWVGLHVPAVRKDQGIWDQAHKVAGPFWLLAALALAFGAAFSFIASGWMWVLPVVALVAAVVAASVGGNFGARAATMVEKAREEEPEPEKPAVNIDALRRAAGQADNK